MKKLLIFSKCIKLKPEVKFHFKGFYRGHKIESIMVLGQESFLLGAEYLLWVRDLEIKNGVLHVELIASKLIYQEKFD